MTKHERFEKEFNSDCICDECGVEMEEIKGKRKNRYSKEQTFFECLICGHKHRKRTLNEIARDCGFRK